MIKHKLWLIQIPVVALFAWSYMVYEAGVEGELNSHVMRDQVFPTLQTVAGKATNAKFAFRGPQAPKNKIVIVEIDDSTIAELQQRWPWHRDMTAALIDRVFEAGAKVVGLDIVFSEPDQRVSPAVAELLTNNKMESMIPKLETDNALVEVFAKHGDRLVTGWTSSGICQPKFESKENCPVAEPDTIAGFPKEFEKFAYNRVESANAFNPSATPLLSLFEYIPNLDMFNFITQHSGFFNAWQEKDGFIRRTNLVLFGNSKPFPSLPLTMAKVGLDEDLKLSLTQDYKVAGIQFAKSGRQIPVSPLGAMQINFRGPKNSFDYVRAIDLLRDDPQNQVVISRAGSDRRIASDRSAIKDMLKDAYVLIGLTALGVFDMRAFPFDENTPGVEGHATILDNLLASDMLVRGDSFATKWTLLIFMTLGALLFAYAAERLESIPGLLLFIFALGGFSFYDFKVLFANNNINWNTSFLYLEMATIFVFTVAVKYVMEERNKKFIKGAFAKYVSPAIIDSIMKDPSKLTVGGEKRDLTILFSDIRSFTTFSEKMDAKELSHFLNEYLGQMTDIVFDNEGTLDKYIGDAVMSFWGAPLDQPKHAANACKAAIQMQRKLNELRPVFKQKYDIDVNVGIGINSGAVSVGNMGSERIFEYTVIGDHVNLASRLEGLTKYYHSGIVTTRFTLDHIQQAGEPIPPHRTLDFVKVKGKKQAVELIQLLDREMTPEGLKTFDEARLLYQKQQWDQAIALFEKSSAMLAAGPDEPDEMSLMYIERCQEFKKSPPSADWDGSWEMTSK